jgi:hypothetical protein
MEGFLEILLENFQETVPQVVDSASTLGSRAPPPHQASSRTQSELPDWSQMTQEIGHDQPDRSNSSLIIFGLG